MKNNASGRSAPNIPPAHEDITLRAILLWQNYGKPEGRDTEIWLEAERQLLGTDRRTKTDGKASAVAISFDEPASGTKSRESAKKSGSSSVRSRR